MPTRKIFTILTAIALTGSVVTATSDTTTKDEIGTKNVVSLGTQIIDPSGSPENIGYFRVAEGWSLAPCAWGVMYFDPTSVMGKGWHATLLTAKAGGLPLGRVVYTADDAASGIPAGFVKCEVSEILELQ